MRNQHDRVGESIKLIKKFFSFLSHWSGWVMKTKSFSSTSKYIEIALWGKKKFIHKSRFTDQRIRILNCVVQFHNQIAVSSYQLDNLRILNNTKSNENQACRTRHQFSSYCEIEQKHKIIIVKLLNTHVDLMVMQRSCSSLRVSVKRVSPALAPAMIPALDT